MMRRAALDALQRIRDLQAQAKCLEAQILAWHRANDASRRLEQIPGLGPLGATALVAQVGNAHQFSRARTLAAWLGLTPREHSSGERRRLMGITKHGNRYLRWLLIHGARAVLCHAERNPRPEQRWLLELAQRRNRNVATVALANKNARIAWAMLTRGTDYAPAAAGA
jgi:transposase